MAQDDARNPDLHLRLPYGRRSPSKKLDRKWGIQDLNQLSHGTPAMQLAAYHAGLYFQFPTGQFASAISCFESTNKPHHESF